ncbi:MAG: hypothetical protein V1846_02140 [Candidatus Komeilibacteria bacterium]
MNLSLLQKYILKVCYGQLSLPKEYFLAFYQGNNIDAETALKDIGKSIDRLVSRDLLKVSGVKTAKKWYTSTVNLTYQGEKMAKKLLSEQPKLFR